MVNSLFRSGQMSWRGKRPVAFDAINLFHHKAQARFPSRAGFSTFWRWSRDHTCSPQAAQVALRPSYLLWCAFLRPPHHTRNARSLSKSHLSYIFELELTHQFVFVVWMEGCHQKRCCVVVTVGCCTQLRVRSTQTAPVTSSKYE